MTISMFDGFFENPNGSGHYPSFSPSGFYKVIHPIERGDYWKAPGLIGSMFGREATLVSPS